MNARISVTGIVEVDNLLKSLNNQVNHRIMGAAHLESAKPLIDAAQNIVAGREKTSNTGRLEQSIGGIKLSQRKTGQIGMVHIGPRRKKGLYSGYHGHLVEHGHRLVSSKKSGKRVIGFVRPYPFMMPAFNKTKDQVGKNIIMSVQNKLMSAMRRSLKKAGKTWIE